MDASLCAYLVLVLSLSHSWPQDKEECQGDGYIFLSFWANPPTRVHFISDTKGRASLWVTRKHQTYRACLFENLAEGTFIFISTVLAFILLVCTIFKRDIKAQGLYSLSDLDSLIYVAIAFSTQSQPYWPITFLMNKQMGTSSLQEDWGVLSQTAVIQVSAISSVQKFQGLLQLTRLKAASPDSVISGFLECYTARTANRMSATD